MKKNNHSGVNADDTRDMSDEDFFMEMQRMEQLLGKEKFQSMLDEAYGQDDDDLDDDEDEFDAPEPVTLSEWSGTHPEGLVCGTDIYYSTLANCIRDIILSSDIQWGMLEVFAREGGRVLAAYFEDIVSGTKVFGAMRRVCMQMYGYRLPFYDCEHEDYMLDHINEEDIRFLLWKTGCEVGKVDEMVFSPLAPSWVRLADKIFDELNDRYEKAPAATRVYDWLHRVFRKEDYTEFRAIARWLVACNPLCYRLGFQEAIIEWLEGAADEGGMDIEGIDRMYYSLLADAVWQRSMSPMGCPTQALVSALAAELGYDAMAQDISEIEVLPKQLYAVIEDKSTRQLYFETSWHQMLEVRRDSFQKGFKVSDLKFVECTLMKFQGQYVLNGMLFGNPSFEAEWEAESHNLNIERGREWACECIKKFDGQQVIYFKSAKEFTEKMELQVVRSRDLPAKNGLVVLLSKDLGMDILPDSVYAFDLPGNRHFRKRKAAKDSFGGIIACNSIPHDVAMYIQEHNLLPEANIFASQGKETGRKIIQDYLAFWLGFYRRLPIYAEQLAPM